MEVSIVTDASFPAAGDGVDLAVVSDLILLQDIVAFDYFVAEVDLCLSSSAVVD